MTLEEYALPLAFEAALWVETVTDPRLSIQEMGELSLKVMRQLRTLAIIALLTRADKSLFGQNLVRSGRVRLAYLERSKREGLDDYHSATARIGGLLDALAASDFELARQVVAASRSDWLRGAEYEDDFCYAQLLHGLLSSSQDPERTAALLNRFEAILDEKSSARLSLSRALYIRNQGAFEEAFDDLISEEQAKIAADKARAQLEEPEVIAPRHIFVEGLAILRLAETRGLVTQPIYLGCPAIARLTSAPIVQGP